MMKMIIRALILLFCLFFFHKSYQRDEICLCEDEIETEKENYGCTFLAFWMTVLVNAFETLG